MLTLSFTTLNLRIGYTHPVAFALTTWALALLIESVEIHPRFASEAHINRITCKTVIVAGSTVLKKSYRVGELIEAWRACCLAETVFKDRVGTSCVT